MEKYKFTYNIMIATLFVVYIKCIKCNSSKVSFILFQSEDFIYTSQEKNKKYKYTKKPAPVWEGPPIVRQNQCSPHDFRGGPPQKGRSWSGISQGSLGFPRGVSSGVYITPTWSIEPARAVSTETAHCHNSEIWDRYLLLLGI